MANRQNTEQKLLQSQESTAEIMGGAAAVILIWVVMAVTQVDVPPEVAAAIGAILTFGAGFLPRTK